MPARPSRWFWRRFRRDRERGSISWSEAALLHPPLEESRRAKLALCVDANAICGGGGGDCHPTPPPILLRAMRADPPPLPGGGGKTLPRKFSGKPRDHGAERTRAGA